MTILNRCRCGECESTEVECEDCHGWSDESEARMLQGILLCPTCYDVAIESGVEVDADAS